MYREHNHNLLASGLMAVLLGAALACSGSDFSGGGSKNSGTPKAKNTDGGESESGTAEAGEATSGDDNNDGLEGSESGDNDGVEGSEAGDNGGAELSDGEEELKKTRSDMKIVQTLADTKLRVKVELLSKAKVIQTEEFDSSGDDGKINKETILKNMCRRDLDTCVKVTFIGEKTQVAGAAECVFTSPLSATAVKLDVDGNGSGLLGKCGPGEDETFEFHCDESKSLKVQGCNG